MLNNKILPLLFVILAGCSNQYESVFEESADERLRKAMEESRSILLDADNGWIATIKTGLGLEFVYYFDFHEDGTVTMTSDFDTTTAETPMNGTYVLRALQRISLVFDTYSYIHLPADPTPDVNDGIPGEGLISDFEFAFDDITPDELIMEGLKRNTIMTMVRATAQERTIMLSGVLKQSLLNSYSFIEDNYYSSVDLGGGLILYTGINVDTKVFTAIYINQNNSFEIVSIPFTYTPDGLLLSGTFTAGNISFNQLLWNNTEQTYYVSIGGTPRLFEGSSTPIIPANVNPPLIDALGGLYSTITIDPSTINGMSDEFLQRYDDVNLEMQQTYGVDLGGVVINFNTAGTQAVITYEFLADGQIIPVDYDADVTYNPGNTISFTLTDPPRTIDAALDPLNSYFASFTFSVDYVPDGNAASLLARLYPEENGHFCYGRLE